jgi:hypothetical protein
MRGLACVALGILLTVDLLFGLAIVANLALDVRAGQFAGPLSLRPLVNNLASLVPTRTIYFVAPLLLPVGVLAALVSTRELRDSLGVDEILRRESPNRPSMILLTAGFLTLVPAYSSLPAAMRARVHGAELGVLIVATAITVAFVQLLVPCWKTWFAGALRSLDTWWDGRRAVVDGA